MRTHVPGTILIAAALLVSCAAPAAHRIPPAPLMPDKTTASPASTDSQTESPGVPTPDIDPVQVGMTLDGVTALCDEHIARARKLLGAIKGLKDKPDSGITWTATLGRVDDIAMELGIADGFPSLMAVGHPDAKVRAAAKLCEPKVEAFQTEMYLDPDVAAVVKRYAERKEPLTGTRARLLHDTVRDLRRNGLELPADQQKQLRSFNEELSKLGQDFESNISDAVLSIKVRPEQLKGLPKAYLDQHKPGSDGLVVITTSYPDYFPVISYAEDRTVARDLTEKFDNRASDKNLKVLDRVLELRSKKARLLGYATWADYAIEPRMAKTPAAVQEFLGSLAREVREPARKEYAEFQREYERIFHAKAPQRIPNYDRLYLEEKLRAKKYGFDSKELSKYFEVRGVTTGLLDIVSKLYGIELRDVPDAAKWHDDVRVLDVMDGGKTLGRIYLDLYPREGKYKHAAMFTIRSGRRLAGGAYLQPIAALECNFPKPGDSPALLTHSEVTTLFHEFGHTLHHVLTQQELSSYSGTHTARDFVEAPSQMFEEWCFRREVLDQFARHYETGKPIPDALFRSLQRSRAFGRALGTERQISLATLDFEYHTRPLPIDTDAVFREVMDKTQLFGYLPNTHFQASFGHLMGYDAGYYGYQWALALARDVLTRFDQEGYLNPTVSTAWRKLVLEQGAGEDENKLIDAFLGRPHNLDAFVRYVTSKEAPGTAPKQPAGKAPVARPKSKK